MTSSVASEFPDDLIVGNISLFSKNSLEVALHMFYSKSCESSVDVGKRLCLLGSSQNKATFCEIGHK